MDEESFDVTALGLRVLIRDNNNYSINYTVIFSVEVKLLNKL